jgi:CHAT domain-containing protein
MTLKNTFFFNPGKLLLAGLFSFLILTINAAGQMSPDIQTLPPNQAVEREIKGGETHRFKISLQKGELFQIRAEQKVINISLKLYNSKGEELITAEKPLSPETQIKTLSLSYVAVNEGDYVLEILAPKIKPLKNSYKLKRAASRAATDEEKKEIAELFAKQADELDKKIYKTRNKEQKNRYLRLTIWKRSYAFSIYENFEDVDSIIGKIKCSRSIAVAYTELSDYQTALKYFERALYLLNEWEKQLSNPNLKVAKTILFNDLGKAYSAEWETGKALFYLNQIDFESEEFWKEHIDILKNASDTLDTVLLQLEDTESYAEVISLQIKLISIAHRYKFFEQEMYLYRNLGSNYIESGLFYSAMESFDKTKELNKKYKNVEISNSLINSIGTIYLRSHNYAKARDYYLLYLKKSVAKKDKLDILLAKANLGCAYVGLKQYSLAKIYLEETLPQIKLLFNYEKAKNYIAFEKWVAMFIVEVAVYYGIVLRESGQLSKSTEIFKENAELAQKYKIKKFQSMALNNLGLNYLQAKDFEAAATFFQESLLLSSAIDTRDEKIAALDGLMRTWQAHNNNSLAIVYGKQSVNLLQTTRAELEKIEKGTSFEFVKNNENTYRLLANLLITEGRLREAHIVLDLLKVEEFKELVPKRGLAYKIIEIFDDETEVLKNRNEAAELSRRKRELEVSRKNKCGDLLKNPDCRLSLEQENEISRITEKLLMVNALFIKLLDKIIEESPDLKDRISETQQNKLTSFLNEHPAVAIYTIVGNNPEIYNREGKFGWILLVTGNTHLAYPIDTKGLNKNIADLQEHLGNDLINPKKDAQELYNRIFRQKSEQGRTLEEDLNDYFKGSKEKVIMWSLDGVLRDVPMAVLHNGQNYLVEEYIQTIFNSESILQFRDANPSTRRILGFGVSKAKTIDGDFFEELKGVERELVAIIRQTGENTGIISGVRKLDDEFTNKTALELMRVPNYSILHFATHFKFYENNSLESFFVTGDGKLTLAHLRETNLFSSSDIVTLSACETLVSGRGKETEGLAVSAQGDGANTVIASLWRIPDHSTPELMIHFYKLLNDKPNLIKGEAFRQTQLALLNGEIKGDLGTLQNNKTNSAAKNAGSKKRENTGTNFQGSTGGIPAKFLLFQKNPDKPFEHPHYWASFVMVGNWR